MTRSCSQYNRALDLHRNKMYVDVKQNVTPSTPVNNTVNPIYMDPLEVLGEKSFNEPREVNESEIGSPVQEFFRDAVVLVTGGTGFFGKILLEKLLRTCPHVGHIYVLIRTKKNQNAEQRLISMFENRVSK